MTRDNEQARMLSERSTQGRYLELDALRGLAAFTVIWHHFGLMFSREVGPWMVPFFAGHQAVVLFFVLSGFVLSLPFWNRGGNGPYSSYVIRRFFRIYVPYVAAAVLAAFCAHFFLFSKLPLGGGWFQITWQTPLTPGYLFGQLLMDQGSSLNTAFWSLRYEMQMSIVFPALLLLVRALGMKLSVLLAVVAFYGSVVLSQHTQDWHQYQGTLRYSSMFLGGAVLAGKRERLRTAWNMWPMAARLCFVAVCLLLYYYSEWLAHALPQAHLASSAELMSAAGAAGLVMSAILARPFRRLLTHRVPEYLGRVSYSMYLVHATVLFTLVNMLYGRVSQKGFAVLYVVITFVLSHAFCVWVEEPSLRLGKRLSSALRKGKEPKLSTG